MGCTVDTVIAWFAESPWEHGLLCAETAVIVVGGPLALWNRLTLKKQIGDLNAKMDRLLGMMESMQGKTAEEQAKIVRKARAFRIEANFATGKIEGGPITGADPVHKKADDG